MITMTIPEKSKKLVELEARAAEAAREYRDFHRTRVDQSGVEILRPEAAQQLREDARRLARAAEETAAVAHDEGITEGWRRATALLSMPQFKDALVAHARARSERLEATAFLLNYMNTAGRDGIPMHHKVNVLTPADVQDLKLFTHGFRLQGLDPKVLTPSVRQWMEEN